MSICLVKCHKNAPIRFTYYMWNIWSTWHLYLSKWKYKTSIIYYLLSCKSKCGKATVRYLCSKWASTADAMTSKICEQNEQIFFLLKCALFAKNEHARRRRKEQKENFGNKNIATTRVFSWDFQCDFPISSFTSHKKSAKFQQMFLFKSRFVLIFLILQTYFSNSKNQKQYIP